jgi:hypothetical protein
MLENVATNRKKGIQIHQRLMQTLTVFYSLLGIKKMFVLIGQGLLIQYYIKDYTTSIPF